MLHAVFYVLVAGLLGSALIVAGFLTLDWFTPGRLPDQVASNMNAAVVAGARLVAVGGIAAVTLRSNADANLWVAVVWTLVFGLVGLALQTLAVVVISLFTGRGGDHIVNRTGNALHPGAVLMASGQIAAALVVIAAVA